MRGRFFFKLLGAFLLVIAVVTVTLGLTSYQAGQNNILALLVATLLAAVVAVALAALLARSTVRRLQRIRAFAERVAAGDLSARVADSAGDEFALLTAALDRTAGKLEQSFSQLEASRGELETLLNSIQDSVVAISPDRRVQWMNRSLRDLLGRPLQTGIPMLEVIRDPGVIQAIEEVLAKRSVQSVSARSVVPNRVFDVSVAPLPSGGVVAVFHDQTQIERVDQTRRDFIANVSHELRTPLTSIRGYAETLLEMPQAGDDVRAFLVIIQKNASRMSRLTEDLLTLAQVESGETKLRPVSVPAATLLREAQQSFGAIAESRGLRLEIAESPETAVKADADAIHQVFANLLENASKYGAAGGRIQIGAHDAADGVEFYTRDFGEGIASAHLPRIFERFYRVDKARSAETGGTGLGLAIVKHLVLNLGGQVRVESELNHGATFYFTLPFAHEAAPTDLAHLSC